MGCDAQLASEAELSGGGFRGGRMSGELFREGVFGGISEGKCPRKFIEENVRAEISGKIVRGGVFGGISGGMFRGFWGNVQVICLEKNAHTHKDKRTFFDRLYY